MTFDFTVLKLQRLKFIVGAGEYRFLSSDHELDDVYQRYYNGRGKGWRHCPGILWRRRMPTSRHLPAYDDFALSCLSMRFESPWRIFRSPPLLEGSQSPIFF